MSSAPELPHDVLASIFTFASPGPNATGLVAVSRSWRPVAEEFLYRSITVFGRNTVRNVDFDRHEKTVCYYLPGNVDQKHGVSIDIVDETGTYTHHHRLDLLCRTLAADNKRLTAHVREIDFCANVPNMTAFVSIANMCRDVTHLRLRGPDDSFAPNDNFRTISLGVKDAIKHMARLQIFAHEGIFPKITLSDVIDILSDCPQLSSLTLRLTNSDSSDSSDSPARDDGCQTHPIREFPQVRKLKFVAEKTHKQAKLPKDSLPTSVDGDILSALSFPNLTTFGACANLDDASVRASLIRCLIAWAPTLTHLTLYGENRRHGLGALDDALASLTSLVELECNDAAFLPRAILRMKAPLECLDIRSWRGYFDNIRRGLSVDRLDYNGLALPHLTLIKLDDTFDSEKLPRSSKRLLEACRARNIAVECMSGLTPVRYKKIARPYSGQISYIDHVILDPGQVTPPRAAPRPTQQTLQADSDYFPTFHLSPIRFANPRPRYHSPPSPPSPLSPL